MSQYLSKEEIKQWRSSLEKCTLEEFAKKLGKTLEEDKKTNDIIDIVTQNEKRLYSTKENNSSAKQILKIAKKSQDMQNTTLKSNVSEFNKVKSQLTCKKPLTQRENAVLAHFVDNKGEIVYARDLAAILNLPTDYVYKYIKNLRTKISEDILENATKGGYIFKF